MMERLVRGEAETHEIDTLEQVTRQIEGHYHLCPRRCRRLANSGADQAFQTGN